MRFSTAKMNEYFRERQGNLLQRYRHSLRYTVYNSDFCHFVEIAGVHEMGWLLLLHPGL